MAITLEELREEVLESLGTTGDVADIITPTEIDRWLNRGQERLSFWKPLTSALTWASGDLSIALPSDFRQFESIRFVPDSYLDPYDFFGNAIYFTSGDGASSDGSGTLFYWAAWPEINSSVDCDLPPVGQEAIVKYAVHRFYQRLAAGRSDYRRYVTLTGGNAVGVGELMQLSLDYLQDFNDLKQEMQTLRPGETYYGD